MKYFFTLFLFIGFVMNNAAQGITDFRLLQQLEKSAATEQIPVCIVLTDQVDLYALGHEFDARGLSLSDRQKLLPGILQRKAVQSREKLIEYLAFYEHFHPGSISAIEEFWIASVVCLKAVPDLIRQLEGRNDVAYIGLNDASGMTPVKPVSQQEAAPKTAGAAEPGLIAIQAPFMWRMGYTGKNRIGFSIDTGVWPDHPALSQRFLANHFPMQQCWFPYDLMQPGDKTGSHGTHTLGTTMGLDPATNDTIGAAFGAYWICSDPVATSLATVKPLSDFMYAFQWALNPDGDTNTVHDIPDVINNSWGYGVATDTLLCDSYVSQMFLAVEAAGIANVFSAGNDGPGAQTIGIPHHLNSNIVNSFTCAAVNANTPGLPIASFSSRGPSICGGSGSLLIKPEVSAPGVDVRSCVDHNAYALYSGTSMSAPHVSGAVLLLREAFPFLPGNEILLALYYTATDLGIAGEDNDYGMGMINLEAAFNYLSSFWTPLPPLAAGKDAAITSVQSPQENFICGHNILPVITLTNTGDSLISGGTFYCSLNGSAPSIHNWNGLLLPGQDSLISLPAITIATPGSQELHLWFESNGITETSLINNHRTLRFDVPAQTPLPFQEEFETGLDPAQWLLVNPDQNLSWDTALTQGLLYSSVSAVMPFSTAIPFNQRDHLIAPEMNLSFCDSAMLRFELAYQCRHPNLTDTLMVSASTDCGQTYHVLYKKGGQELQTLDTATVNFKPLRPEHWRTEYVSLAALQGQPSVLLRFTGINRKGNPCYIDRLKIYCGEEPAGVEENPSKMELFPNPVSGRLNIRLPEAANGNVSFKIYDMSGRLLLQQSQAAVDPVLFSIGTGNFSPGMYLLEIITNTERYRNKFMIR